MNTHTQKLADDLKVLVRDAEELVKATAQDAGGTVVELRRRMQRAVDEVKPQLASIETAVTEKATSAVRLTDSYVHEQPWAAVGLSAAIGLIIGLLLSRH
jgi:ElaB/YqjD/DUF883 family membrane-anchored ribosome-binding protein